MTDKIKSIADLEKTIEDDVRAIEFYLKEHNQLPSYVMVRANRILEKIGELKTKMAERAKDLLHSLEVKDYPQDKVSVVVDEAILEELLNEYCCLLKDWSFKEKLRHIRGDDGE